jgi:DNA-binding beta-propeller fold protein YncE
MVLVESQGIGFATRDRETGRKRVVRGFVGDTGRSGRFGLKAAALRFAAFGGALVCSALGLGSSTAGAAPPELWTKCNPADPAIQCNIPRGVAANPENGRVFVADQENHRVLELNARGEFIKTWGWDVVEGGGEGFEVCVLEDGDICKTGSIGDGTGQFGVSSSQGVALDSIGSVYVVDRGLPSNQRVQKFDAEGNFVLMFGGDVNKTKVEEPGSTEAQRNLCTAVSGDECRKGSKGSGKGQFGEWPIVGGWIAIDTKATEIDADDRIYVGDVKRIQVFDSGGHYLEDVPLDPVGALKDNTVQGLSVDSSGNLYVIYDGKADVRKLTAAGKELEAPRFKVADPTAVAVDFAGSVYTFRSPGALGTGSERHPIFKFDPSGNLLEEFGKGQFSGASTGLATNLCPGSEAPGNLYTANPTPEFFVRAYGTDPLGCFKARTLPANPIAETSATLNGTVTPKGEAVTECFFRWGETTAYGQTAPCVPGAGEIGTGSSPVPVHADLTGLERGTVYHFRLIARVGGEAEPGSDEAFKTRGPPVISDEHVVSATDTEATLRSLANPEGFATSCHFEYGTTTAYGQSTPAEAIGSDRSEHLLSASLQGLTPGTPYHWRIVCTNSSDTTEGGDHTFATSEPPALDAACSNQAFRAGASAFLPDCRAYEMVSPIDKNGGNILLLNQGNIQAAAEGDKLTYNTIPAFGDAQNSWATNQYLAARTERGQPGEGWSNHGIHPPVIGRAAIPGIVILGGIRDFLAFTPDLCVAWIYDYLEPSLTAEGQDGYTDFYRRENCGPEDGRLEALTAEPPPLPQGTPFDYNDPERTPQTRVQGVSDDGRHAIFGAKAPLLQDCRTTNSTKVLTYQWLRNGVSIAGATSPVYTASAADMGAALQCQVFAITDNAGSTQVANPPSIIPPAPGVTIAPPTAPESIAPPAVAPPGPLTVGGPGGQTLTCDPGSWKSPPAKGPVTFTYQWYRNGVAISGATASTYLVSAADVASAALFQCAVRGANADGAVTKVSGSRPTNPLPSPLPAAANANVGGEIARVYDHFGGELHLVSILPNGRVATTTSEAGRGGGAVSADGSHVYWITGSVLNETARGQIYLRLHPEQGVVPGECADAARACTLLVSAGSEAFFWTSSADGSRALYSEGVLGSPTSELLEFNLNAGAEPKTRSVAKGLEGLVRASDDLSRIYFVSRSKLTDEAIEGESNLYLDEGGALHHVATLGEGEVASGQLGTVSRISPDGSRLVFQSRAPLTDYDNTDADNGKADVEVFAYEAGGELHCISCNPSGARPTGRELRKPFWSTGPQGHGVFAAAWIPAPELALHASNLVSADGERIFFNSNDALLPRDTNGTMDVYQWEAPGKGSCDTADPGYFAQNGGCLDLISTGESPFESEFWEASADGDDVFFTTESSLVSSDPGLVDLYDARVGGGFPQPVAKEPCEGEACQSPPPPPAYGTPASAAFSGPGDPKPGKGRKTCPKGKRKVRKGGKVRCVKRKGQKGQKKRKAAHNRRAPR